MYKKREEKKRGIKNGRRTKKKQLKLPARACVPLRLHNLAGEFTPPSDPDAVEDEDPRDGSQHQTDAAEEAARPLERHAVVHGIGNEREEAAEHVAAEGLRREGGARVAVVRVCKVVEHCQVHREDADGHHADRTRGQDPVLTGERRPPEPEHADGEQRAQDARSVEARLGAGGVGQEAVHRALDETVKAQGEQRAHAHGREDGANLGNGEAVRCLEDQRHALEEPVRPL